MKCTGSVTSSLPPSFPNSVNTDIEQLQAGSVSMDNYRSMQVQWNQNFVEAWTCCMISYNAPGERSQHMAFSCHVIQAEGMGSIQLERLDTLSYQKRLSWSSSLSPGSYFPPICYLPWCLPIILGPFTNILSRCLSLKFNSKYPLIFPNIVIWPQLLGVICEEVVLVGGVKHQKTVMWLHSVAMRLGPLFASSNNTKFVPSLISLLKDFFSCF